VRRLGTRSTVVAAYWSGNGCRQRSGGWQVGAAWKQHGMLQLVGPGSTKRGGVQGELVRTSTSWEGLEFRWRNGTPEQGSAQGEIGGKSPPPEAWGWQ
jgi:hypothetical protein